MWSHREEEKLHEYQRSPESCMKTEICSEVFSLRAADIDPMMTSEQIFIFHCVWFPLLLSCTGEGVETAAIFFLPQLLNCSHSQ